LKSIESLAAFESFGRERLSPNFFMREFRHSEIATWWRKAANHAPLDSTIYGKDGAVDLFARKPYFASAAAKTGTIGTSRFPPFVVRGHSLYWPAKAYRMSSHLEN
jgi:hypothetical protein